MLKGRKFVKWSIFFKDDDVALQAHFDAGGTVEMLNGEYNQSSNGEHLALWHCVDEFSIKCLRVLMANGAKPNNDIWQLAFRLDRCEWVHYFLKIRL